MVKTAWACKVISHLKNILDVTLLENTKFYYDVILVNILLDLGNQVLLVVLFFLVIPSEPKERTGELMSTLKRSNPLNNSQKMIIKWFQVKMRMIWLHIGGM